MSEKLRGFVVYKNGQGEWRWTLYAANNLKIADGSEGYKRRVDCLHGARLVAGAAADAPIFNRETGTFE